MSVNFDQFPAGGDRDPVRFAGEFSLETMHMLAAEAKAVEDRPVSEFFAVLHGAVTGQGHQDLAAAIQRLAQTPGDTLIRGEYEPRATLTINGVAKKWETAEQTARSYVASGVGRMLADIYTIDHSPDHLPPRERGTSTIADLRIGSEFDRELFIIFARMLARDPMQLEVTQPTPDEVTDIALMNISPESRATGVVTLDGQPNKLVRFQKTTIDSTVAGYNFELWRHNHAGHIRGDASDMQKLYLEKK